jgi:hypothetical protein
MIRIQDESSRAIHTFQCSLQAFAKKEDLGQITAL